MQSAIMPAGPDHAPVKLSPPAPLKPIFFKPNMHEQNVDVVHRHTAPVISCQVPGMRYSNMCQNVHDPTVTRIL